MQKPFTQRARYDEIATGTITNASYTKHTIPITGGLAAIYLLGLDLSWHTETGAIATIDWYVTYDSTGDKMAMRNKQSTFINGTTAATGGVQETVETMLCGLDGNIYVWLKADANGATIAQLRVTYEV
jgi:hypothetical protein